MMTIDNLRQDEENLALEIVVQLRALSSKL